MQIDVALGPSTAHYLSMQPTNTAPVTTLSITMTREEALSALVEADVVKWGEDERTASAKMHAGKTHGAMLVSLGATQILFGDAKLGRALNKAGRAIGMSMDERRGYLQAG